MGVLEVVIGLGVVLCAFLVVMSLKRLVGNGETLAEDDLPDHDKANELADQVREIADSLGLSDDQKEDLEIDMEVESKFGHTSTLRTMVRLLPQIGSRKLSEYSIADTCLLIGVLDPLGMYITVDDLTPEHVELNNFLNKKVFGTKKEKKVHAAALDALLSLNEYPEILHAMRDLGITDPKEAVKVGKSLSESGVAASSDGAV